MKKIITTTALVALLSQTAAAHEGHHDDGLSSLLMHLSTNPDHWIGVLVVLAAATAGIALYRRSRNARTGSDKRTH